MWRCSDRKNPATSAGAAAAIVRGKCRMCMPLWLIALSLFPFLVSGLNGKGFVEDENERETLKVIAATHHLFIHFSPQFGNKKSRRQWTNEKGSRQLRSAVRGRTVSSIIDRRP
jgi:hypothetical protein